MTWFLLLLSSYPDLPPHIHTLLSLLPIISKKEGTRYLSNVTVKQQPAGALAAFLHPVIYASISLYTPHTHSLCSLLLEVPSDCASGPLLHPASDQKQTRNNWVDLFLPRVRQDPKMLRIQSYLIPHLILTGNDTILWTAFLV